MPFGVEWAPRGDDDYNRLPPLLASRVLEEIDKLAANPLHLSRPAKGPNQLYQRHVFLCEHDGEEVVVTIVFQYSQDELSIEIMGIGLPYR